MTFNWTDAARELIKEIDATLPADATLKQRKAALREHAWRHHGGTSWGKKTWSRAAREYLELHGQPPRTIADASPLSKLFSRMQAGDIVLMKDLP